MVVVRIAYNDCGISIQMIDVALDSTFFERRYASSYYLQWSERDVRQ
jgi:hypothetical protein